jgi:hypothetical protein
MNPWDSVPEGYCPMCKGFTTDYNNQGECRDHHVLVTAEITQEDDEDENCIESS